MKRRRSGGILSVAAAAAVGALAGSLWRAGASATVRAGCDGEPIMTVVDERKLGADEAEPTIYVLWPGRKTVEAFVSGGMTFMSYDFATRTVTYSEADIK